MRELDEGGLAGHFVVGAEVANELLAALETARTTHADDVRSPAQRTADAAGAVFAFSNANANANANHDRSGTPRHRPHVELIAHTYPELEQLIVDGAVRWPDPQRLFEALAAGCVTTLEGSCRCICSATSSTGAITAAPRNATCSRCVASTTAWCTETSGTSCCTSTPPPRSPRSTAPVGSAACEAHVVEVAPHQHP